MIRVNLADGSTEDREEPATLRPDVRAVQLSNAGSIVTVGCPSRFDEVVGSHEPVLGADGKIVAERATWCADDVELTVTSYVSRPFARVDLRRSGRIRYLAEEGRRSRS